mgnify:CR=1 FL=1
MASNDWWSKKLGNNSPRQSMPPTGPSQPIPYNPPAQQNNPQVAYNAETDQLVTRAQSARHSSVCPECNSGNYFAPTGTQRQRCYDCGYPIMQQGSGVSGTGNSSGPVQKAKQVGQSGGFNPNVIVDRM